MDDQTMRALADAATQGPWDVTDVPRIYAPCTEDESLEPLGDFDHYADAEFIAAAREWVPDALERLAIAANAVELANETTATYKARWRDAVARNDALEEQTGRVLDLHWGDVSVGIHAHICAECRQEYPCPTIRALDGDMS